MQKLYSTLLPMFINELGFAIISIIFMLMTSIKLTLIIIPFLFLYYLFGPYFEKKHQSVRKICLILVLH